MDKRGTGSVWGKWTAVGTAFLAASILLQLAARKIPGFGQWYAVTVYPWLVSVIGRFFGLFPISAVELLLYILLLCLFGFFLWCAWGLVRGRRIFQRKIWRRFGRALFLMTAFLMFSYTACCGVNYYRNPFSSYLDFPVEKYSKEELAELCGWLTAQVNGAWEETKYLGHPSSAREGETDLKAGELANWQRRELPGEAVRTMKRLGEEYPALSGFYPPPKPLTVSRILSVQQLAGIYSPFTVEANYNNEMVAYNIPHTVCHELSHLKGFMREDEANFIGFLACIGSEDSDFRYSGYLMGWIYGGNALAAVDFDAYAALYGELRPEIQEELHENSVFWGRFESKISEAAETMNNTYLKANNQPDGVKSYGRVVDLMLAWYDVNEQ